MNRPVRRIAVTAGVIASLLIGIVSIRLAAELTAAAAPPPAPPISMSELNAKLLAEQARAESLQQQLDDLLGVTGDLTSALSAAEGQVSVDGLTAAQLRDRLKAAEKRLALVNRLLRDANQRLAALGAATKTPPPVSGGGSSGGGGGTTPVATPRPTPTPAPGGFSLALSLAGGGVFADWTTCTAAGFDSYALVRSADSEIHYPPEDRDTVVTRITSVSTTSASDAGAPTGKSWYRVWCLTRSDGETRTAATTSTVAITVP
jgi:hypothetical protein